MLLIGSLVFVLGTCAVLGLNLDSAAADLRFGYEQMIHARIPWLVLGSLAVGCVLGIASIAQRRAWYKYPVVGVELLLSALLAWYFLGFSYLPPHDLQVHVGDAFPTYSLPDHKGRIHSLEAAAPRQAALYIFYRGDW